MFLKQNWSFLSPLPILNHLIDGFNRLQNKFIGSLFIGKNIQGLILFSKKIVEDSLSLFGTSEPCTNIQ